MMPEVTVFERSKGAPMATTGSPTCTFSELPRLSGLRPRTPLTLTTARSYPESRPTSSAVTLSPVLKVTAISLESATTWLLVRMWPCSSRTKPVPVPLPFSPRTCRVTTPGSAVAAIPATLPGARPLSATAAWGSSSRVLLCRSASTPT